MTRILVLPGLGDIYWVAVGLQSFLQRQGVVDRPELWIWDFDGRPRALDYVSRIPFVTPGGYWTHTHEVPEFREAYHGPGRSVFPEFHGFDWFLSANGILKQGGTVEQAFPGCEIDWRFPLAPLEERPAPRGGFVGRKWQRGNGLDREEHSYLVAFVSDHGMFRHWTRRWTDVACTRWLRQVQDESGLEVILTGSAWDRPFSDRVARMGGITSLVGQTDYAEFESLFRGAAGCLGFCGGNTIFGTYLGIPTQIVWSRKQFPRREFFRNAVAPGSPYDPVVVEETVPKTAARHFVGMLDAARVAA